MSDGSIGSFSQVDLQLISLRPSCKSTDNQITEHFLLVTSKSRYHKFVQIFHFDMWYT